MANSTTSELHKIKQCIHNLNDLLEDIEADICNLNIDSTDEVNYYTLKHLFHRIEYTRQTIKLLAKYIMKNREVVQ